MDPYALNEETPKAVCALNSKGEKKKRRRKEEGERIEGDDERATLLIERP